MHPYAMHDAALAAMEYGTLVHVLELSRVPLDFYEPAPHDLKTVARTPSGASLAQSAPGYAAPQGIAQPARWIRLPMNRPDRLSRPPVFLPTSWDAYERDDNLDLIWPQWRIEVWHEVGHQWEDEKMAHTWNPDPDDPHLNWEDAMGEIAPLVGASRQQLIDLLR